MMLYNKSNKLRYANILNCLYLVYISCTLCGTNSTDPTYLTIFNQHKTWQGSYSYNNTDYFCTLIISSEHYLRPNGLLATFQDRLGSVIEMDGESTSTKQLEVTFTMHVSHNNSGSFPGNFSFHGTLGQDNDKWKYMASVTYPENGLFGNIILYNTDDQSGLPFDGGSQSWRYFVVIGVPILLAAVGIGGAVGMFYWAIKKGYIRHVPGSYKHFDNHVDFDNKGDTVHI